MALKLSFKYYREYIFEVGYAYRTTTVLRRLHTRSPRLAL